jgi:hypothetical protein
VTETMESTAPEPNAPKKRGGLGGMLLADLKAMGATNALLERSRRPASRRLLARAAQIYAERFADADGRVRATFEILSLAGWAPHESQQKPARRGSGQVSLAQVLRPRGGD